MRALKFALALLVAVVLHIAGVRLVPGFSEGVDLFLVVLVFHGLDGNTLAGVLGGMAAGLVTDALTGGLFGLHGVADTIIGYGTAYAAQRLVIRRANGVFLLFALAAAVQEVILVAVSLLLLPAPAMPLPLAVVTRTVSAGLIGTVIFLIHTRLRARVELWRRTRTAKLRFDRR